MSNIRTDKVPAEVVEILQQFERVKRRGDVQSIAKKCRKSEVYTGYVLHGIHYNSHIIEEAFNITMKRLAEMASMSQKLKQFTV